MKNYEAVTSFAERADLCHVGVAQISSDSRLKEVYNFAAGGKKPKFLRYSQVEVRKYLWQSLVIFINEGILEPPVIENRELKFLRGEYVKDIAWYFPLNLFVWACKRFLALYPLPKYRILDVTWNTLRQPYSDNYFEELVGKRSDGGGYSFQDGERDLSFEIKTEAAAKKLASKIKQKARGVEVTVRLPMFLGE